MAQGHLIAATGLVREARILAGPGVFAIAGGGYINDQVFRLTPVGGTYLPVIVFGPLVVTVLAELALRRRLNLL